MIKKILSTLLHHANRTSSSKEFYEIKDLLLTRFGTIVGYDVQFIDGKKCFACRGSGIYVGYDDYGYQWSDTCNRCWRGWFKAPTWNVLAKIRFGKFTFHTPKERCYSADEVTTYLLRVRGLAHSEFNGYVEHRRSEYGEISLVILFLLFEKPIPRDYGFGLGWRTGQWWKRPKGWLNNILWFYHRRHRNTAVDLYRWAAAKTAERFPEWVEE